MNSLRRSGALMVVFAAIMLAVPALAGDADDGTFELIILDVTGATNNNTLILGRVKNGSVSVGDSVCVPSNSGDPVTVPVTAIHHETMKVEKAEKGWRVELYVEGIESFNVRNDGRVAGGDCQ